MSDRHPSPHRELPALGRRGGGWVAVQVVLIGGILLSARTGRGWSSAVAPFAYALGGVLIAAGVVLLLSGSLGLGRALTPFPAPRTGSGLQTTGIYALVRHPMYGGGIMAGGGWSILFATPLGFVLTVLLAVFADLKGRREELWLEQAFSDYGDYRGRTTHKFIPFVW